MGCMASVRVFAGLTTQASLECCGAADEIEESLVISEKEFLAAERLDLLTELLLEKPD